MKTLFLMRHAKSSWENADLADHERPLNDRGRRAAAFMGEFMSENGLIPQTVLVSTAKRAAATASHVVDSSGLTIMPVPKGEIYEASPQRLVEVVRTIEGDMATAMLIGHNPGMEGLIRHLTGSIQAMPTAALAVLELNINSWADAGPGCGRVHAVHRPRQLMKDD